MRILVCLDSSPSSLPVLESLSTRVWPAESTVKLITSVPPAETNFLDRALQDSYRIEKHATESAQRFLQSHVLLYASRLAHLTIQTEVLLGRPKEALLHYADDWHPDLFIVGSGGKRDFDPLMLGSVSQAVLEHASCPVLIARKNSEASSTQEQMHILVPLDHSPFSAAAVNWLLLQKWVRPVRIHLLSVIPRLTCQYAEEEDTVKAEHMLSYHHDMEDAAMRLMQKCAQRLKPEFGTVTCEVVEGEAREMILCGAEQWPADLIVMGSHGLSGIKRFLLGSVSRTVSVHAQCSVEVIRRQAPGQQSTNTALKLFGSEQG